MFSSAYDVCTKLLPTVVSGKKNPIPQLLAVVLLCIQINIINNTWGANVMFTHSTLLFLRGEKQLVVESNDDMSVIHLNSIRQTQNVPHFVDMNLKSIFSVKIVAFVLEFNSSLVQVMAWHPTGMKNHYHNHWWLISIMHIASMS